jgi:hypothetical protein
VGPRQLSLHFQLSLQFVPNPFSITSFWFLIPWKHFPVLSFHSLKTRERERDTHTHTKGRLVSKIKLASNYQRKPIHHHRDLVSVVSTAHFPSLSCSRFLSHFLQQVTREDDSETYHWSIIKKQNQMPSSSHPFLLFLSFSLKPPYELRLPACLPTYLPTYISYCTSSLLFIINTHHYLTPNTVYLLTTVE